MKKHIPNSITSLNLAAGFIAVIFAAAGDLVTASWLILAAMVFDFLDGFSSRLLHAYSVMGKELDSLADIVSFGVAPAVIVYQLIARALSLPYPAILHSNTISSSVLLLITSIMPVCAGLRLAKFNTDETQTTSFKGLPTPANALAVISLVIASHYSDSRIAEFLTGSVTGLIIFLVVVSLLMVTRLPLLSLKFSHLGLKGNEGRYLLVLLIVIALIFWGLGATPLIIPLYLIASLISLLIK